jgi:hypothetical protein
LGMWSRTRPLKRFQRLTDSDVKCDPAGSNKVVQRDVVADGAPGMANSLKRPQANFFVLDARHTRPTDTLPHQAPRPPIYNPSWPGCQHQAGIFQF